MPIETPSDREYPCFFCTKGASKDRFGQCPVCANPIDVSDFLLEREIGGYTIQRAVGRGYYGLTFLAKNKIGKEFALKIVPKKLYHKHNKNFNEEVSKYQKLGTHPNIAELMDASSTEIDIIGQHIEFFVVIMEWIDGVTLTEFMESGKVTANEICSIILDISSAIERFERENLWHNDLNSDNILLKAITHEERRTRKIDSQFTCKIVDIGSAVFRQAPLPGRLSDLVFFGHHINNLRKAALKLSENQTREDEFFLNALERVVARLLDEDSTRSITAAEQVSLDVLELHNQRFMLSEVPEIELSDPFAYLNANDFPNESYINYLFSGLFPWVNAILTPEAQGTLITGPRGSGKTMILRSMRLKTRLHPFAPDETAEHIRERIGADPQLGFYVSARMEIGNHCALSKLPKWTESEEAVVYYFLLLYAVEIFDTFNFGLIKNILSFDSTSEAQCCQFVCSALCLPEVVSFTSLYRELRVRQYAIERDSNAVVPQNAMLNSNFFSEITGHIKSLSPCFHNKSITFMLDDFSLPKIPKNIQQVLLPLIWNSGGGYSFRVSAHSESVVATDIRGNRYEVNREYREINLGSHYIDSIDISKNEFAIESYINDIFARRFRISKTLQGATLDSILGPDFKGQIAEVIRGKEQSKSLRTLRYHGKNTLLKLCSGDISYLIDMLGQMMRIAQKHPVGIDDQNNVIRQYARKELYRLNDCTTVHVVNLYDVALNFGKLSKFKLLDKLIKDRSNYRPAEYLRIEVALDENLEKISLAIAELLQNGVFVDGGFSNSSQAYPARRLIFRKIFTPAFPTTYNSRDTFPMTATNFSEFVKHPEKFVRIKLAEGGVKPEDQQSLLDSLIDPVR
jgi:serine/threonine protein kinase